MDIRTILADHGIEDASKASVDGDIAGLIESVSDLNQFITTTFYDGIISEMEAKKIQVYVNILSDANTTLNERFTQIINNEGLKTEAVRLELTTSKSEYDRLYTDLLSAINSAISDNVATTAESELVDSAYLALIDGTGRLERAMESASDDILNQRADLAEINAKKHADEIKTGLQLEIADLSKQLETTEGYIDESFRDGIISEMESANIKTSLQNIQLQKTEFDNRYTEIYGNYYLDGVPKMNLADAKAKYDAKYNALITAIEVAITDNAATPEESAEVQLRFDELEVELALLTVSFEKAIEAYTRAKADAAEQSAREFASEEVEIVKKDIVYKVEITSTNGLVFKNGQIQTVLEARVYHGAKDVTAEVDASRFKWSRQSNNPEEDEAWNTSHFGGTKTITVTSGDIHIRATFTCDILDQ